MTLSIYTLKSKMAFFYPNALLGFVFTLLSLTNASAEELPMVVSPGAEIEKPLIPEEWVASIVMPSLDGMLTVVSSVFNEATGNTDLVVRYSLKNDGDEKLNAIQLSVDLQNQLGGTFLGVNGALTTLTGSGGVLTGSTSSIYGGNLNPLFDGNSNITLFDGGPKPMLEMGDCLAIDIPVQLGPNPGLGAVQLTGSGSFAFAGASAPVSFRTAAINVLPGCQSESLACAGRVNVTLGTECYGVVTLRAVFLNSDKDPLRYSVKLFDKGVGIGDTVFAQHVGKQITYEVQDACFNNKVSCWGIVNVENKRVPDPQTTKYNYICGEDYDDLASVDDVIEAATGNCVPPMSNVAEVYTTVGDKCTGYITTRSIMADLDLGSGGKVRAPIHIDSIMEMPIDTNDINGPHGELFEDALMIPCGLATMEELTPKFIEDYYNGLAATTGSGTAYAYPYIDRGSKITKTEMEVDSIRERIVRDSVVIIDNISYTFDVVVKDTIDYIKITYDTTQNLVGLGKGNICNLAVRCADQLFASCAGPEANILRTWTVLDWCSGRLKFYDQWIIIKDIEAPSIKPIANLEAKLIPWDCSAEIALSADIWDDCSGLAQEHWESSAGTIVDGVLKDITFTDNPITVTLTATDACENDSILTFQVNVVDDVRPIAVALDQLNASLIYDPIELRGITKVFVDGIDLGSHDSDCGEVFSCVLLDSELQNPIYVGPGDQATDIGGNLLYHAMQCHIDGIYYDTTYTNKTEYEVDEIPYVICKEFVKFCCGDIGIQKVALVVNDNSPRSENGVSWTDVNVEDKTTTLVRCEPVYLECGDDTSIEVIGEPQVIFAICEGGVLTNVDVEDVDGCGEGRITRQWYLDDELRCEQIIYINGFKPFDPTAIKWPKHYNDAIVSGIRRECENDTLHYILEDIDMGESFTCGGDVLDAPSWCESSCSMLAMSHEDIEVDADGGCRKIIRKWTIIDWCNYTVNGNNVNDDVTDSFVAFDDESMGEGDWRADTAPNEPCEKCDHVKGEMGDIYFRYENVDVDGYYTYDQVIKITDDTAPEIDAPAVVNVEIFDGASSKNDTYEACVGDTTITVTAVELCGDIVLDSKEVTWLIEVIDEEGTVISTKNTKGASATMNSRPGAPTERHIIKWFVSDGCGNDGYTETAIRFEDTRAPTPVCLATISTATMNVETGAVQIWAEEFDRGSYDNCSPVKVFFKNDLGFELNSLTFACEDIPNGSSTMKEIKMYVLDESGNEDFCYVSLRIDDNNDICPDQDVEDAMIAGAVVTAKGDMVEKAIVTLSAGEEEITGVEGTFAFDNNDLYSAYRLTSAKNDDALNGVTTLDLVLIQRHILGISIFQDPYQVIAGDINSDTRISSIDLVQLRRLILGITEGFTENESWRFLQPGQSWESNQKPFPYIEELVIQQLTADMTDLNFDAIKIGDVSGNAIANSLLAGPRSGGELELVIQDQFIKAGETVKVPVRVTSPQELAAYQMTISSYKGKVNGLIPGQLWISDANYASLDARTTTVAWYNAQAQEVDDVLMYVSVTASEDALISDLIEFNSKVTNVEAYDKDYTKLAISTSFLEAKEIAGDMEFALLQNQPNPFSDVTKIGFILSEAGDVTLTISDVAGKLIKVIEGNYQKGSHAITLTRNDLQASGVVYYQLESGQFSDTRKMIIIE
ncbi:MAG: hypothetical protein ACJA01_002477 [Saprospiraceae bacterium]|jgi:hypothetical protein